MIGVGSDAQVGRFFAPLDLRQAQQVFDDRIEPIGLPGDDRQKPHGVVAVVERAVEQGFDETLDRGDRRFQFMRDIGDEIAAEAFEQVKLGHVAQHDDGADAAAPHVAQGRAADVQNLFAVAMQHQVVLDRLGAEQRAAGETAQIGIADHLLQTAAAEVDRLAADQFGRGPIQADHALVGIDGQHPFGHAGEHGFLLVTLAADRMRRAPPTDRPID